MAASTAPPPYPVVRFTVDEYHRFAELGLLDEMDRIELLEGCLVPKMTRSPQHAYAIELLSDLLQRILPAGWRIRVQLPITTPDSEPEPDLAIVRRDRQSTGHPTSVDVGLVIEVSDSSLSQDRVDKARLYARAGIVEYWVLNLRDRQLEVFQHPSELQTVPRYAKVVTIPCGQSVELHLDGIALPAISVTDMLAK